MNIGKKIKRLRIQNQLTLEELANRSELTKGFLSQVERDLTSPSISTLDDILEALGTSLFAFFKEDTQEQIVFSENDFFINEQDGYNISYIIPNAQKNSMEPILIHLTSGACSQKKEPTDGEEFGYVLQGKVILYYGDEKCVVKKGETFYIDSGRTHYLCNEFQKDAKVIWVSTPPSF
jgi:Predicted transcriptional regulators